MFGFLPHHAFMTLTFVLLSTCSSSANNSSSVEATWKFAEVRVPSTFTRDGEPCRGTFASKTLKACLEGIDNYEANPMVLFLHGCAGIRPIHRHIINDFYQLGYIVIAPDSFARPNRVENCTKRHGRSAVLALRFEEIRYALAQIAEIDWIDSNRMVLAGFSEGGITVAEYTGADVFKGYIVMGWDCRKGLYPSGPVLSIVGENDSSLSGACSVGGRPSSMAVVVPNAGHPVGGRPETVDAIQKFLSSVL